MRKARLPGAARPGERQQPRAVLQQRRDLGQLLLAAEERRRRYRQIRPVQRLEGWERAVAELVHALGSRQVLEAVLAEIGQLELEQAGRGRRDEHLSTVAGSGDAGGTMDVVADVALFCQQRGARVQPRANPDRTGRERLRHRLGGRDGAGSRREDEEKCVALRVHFDAALLSTGLPDRPAMLRQGLGVCVRAELVEQLRRSLDVGEEERDRAGREIRAHSGMMLRG